MSDIKDVNRYKTNIDTNDIEAPENPIKPLHSLGGKYFILIDSIIVRQLSFDETETELYFEQTIDEHGSIILRPRKLTR